MQKCNARQPQLSADANATMARNTMKHERMKRNGKKRKDKGEETLEKRENISSHASINATIIGQEVKMHESKHQIRSIPTRKTRTIVQLDRPVPRLARHRALRS